MDSSNRRIDPRRYQIAVLGALLAYGCWILDFDVSLQRAALLIGTAVVTQYACTIIWKLPGFDARSALISGLSLCLLLRTNSQLIACATAVAAISSKFVIRVRGKHLFNPTNFGIVALMAATGDAWVSPGQWGNATLFAFFLACLGGLVVNRAERGDVTVVFIASWTALVCGRSVWLGEPPAIPIHRLENGALLLFTFFMISDPKTTPDSRAGRSVFAMLVALCGWYVQFRWFRTNGLLWSLAGCSMLVPLIDRLLPARRYGWVRARDGAYLDWSTVMTRIAIALVAVVSLPVFGQSAGAFCGFYVAKADTKLFNRASQVVLVRDGDRTVLTMANDFKGNAQEFAIVIPVPTRIQREQIHVGDQALIDHLDGYSAPRLVEYFDENPCGRRVFDGVAAMASPPPSAPTVSRQSPARSLGVTIEARYSVGEYDIVILSATQSTGLDTWLRENGYRIPAGAASILGSYIRQNMHFFVAKVNLKEQAKLGFSYLRPIQVGYESPRFMLPIRLGMMNADGPQELFVYTLTRKGRVETTNYRTIKLPTGMDIPVFVKQEFSPFYKAMFSEQVRRERMSSVFVEYAWDTGSCDPCAAEPLTSVELRSLGVFWLDDQARFAPTPGPPGFYPFLGRPRPQGVLMTRLHVRYDRAHFPEDLVFQETADRENFQSRYVLRHPWTGAETCSGARRYQEELPGRQEHEVQTLASLTGWKIDEIRKKANAGGAR
jgi:Na+-translocating ferredoxin:NAD+ oxidoreductase RnfD subunit